MDKNGNLPSKLALVVVGLSPSLDDELQCLHSFWCVSRTMIKDY